MILSELRERIATFGFTDYLRQLPAVEASAVEARPLRIAILRTYTVEPIEPVLRLSLLLDGYRPTFWFGGYNQHAQQILDPSSELHRFGPDVVLLMLRIEELAPDFVDEFHALGPPAWHERLAGIAADVAGLAGRASTSLSAQVIVQNAALTQPFFGVFDAQRHDGQRHLLHEFNRALAQGVEGQSGVYIWDFERYALSVGLDAISDPKAWYVSRNPYKQSAYPGIGGDLFRSIRSAVGRVKKCVVLDLDNTLWGGVVGEDGIEGIALGQTYPGNCYRDFQRALLRLYHRGILLAINSKNNPEDALRILDEHPDMVLRREHFAAMRINWQDKATNLRELVHELNIGMESIVFVDDNPAEAALVRQECPECDVVVVPHKPYLIPSLLQHLPGVDNIRLTAEDRGKGAMYRAVAARREQREQHSNIEDFLRGLDIEVDIEPATPFSVPRIAQLTQKTNQWNMTTRRYTDAQIEMLARDPRRVVLSVASRDRFGDDGIVGAAILEFSGDECVVDTLLLSCRVIGRGIEHLVLSRIAEIARERGARTLAAEFIPTKKNKPAEGFYERAGLARTTGGWHRASLATTAFPAPGHIRVRGASTRATSDARS